MASGVIDDEDPALAHLYAMWVAPGARGSGAAGRWSKPSSAGPPSAGPSGSTTSVTEDNAAAAALYAAAGFADTGRREPLGHSEGVVAVLERALP